MDEVRYYSIRWDGHTHYIAECNQYDLLICLYRGYHDYRRDEVTLYPAKPGMAYGDIGKKKIDVRKIMPKEWRFRDLQRKKYMRTKWIYRDATGDYECEYCGMVVHPERRTRYCPKCGREVKEEKEKDDE